MPFSPSTRRFRRILGTALTGALCISAASVSAASAGPIDQVVATTPSGINILETPDTQKTCTAPQLVFAFAGLGDMRDYVLAPGGSFEGKGLAGWQIEKAKVGGDGSPLEPTGLDNRQSLTVPPGGSATSPAMCVDLNYPTMRLMAKAPKGQGQLRIQVVYPDSDNPVFHDAGSLAAGPAVKDWQATSDLPVYPERGGASAGMRRVALRFTSIAGNGPASEWRIDDLYVDPAGRH